MAGGIAPDGDEQGVRRQLVDVFDLLGQVCRPGRGRACPRCGEGRLLRQVQRHLAAAELDGDQRRWAAAGFSCECFEGAQEGVESFELRRSGGASLVHGLVDIGQTRWERGDEVPGPSEPQLGAAVGTDDEEERSGQHGTGSGESRQQPARSRGHLVGFSWLSGTASACVSKEPPPREG